MTGLEANHQVEGSEEQCLIYLIEGAAGSVLYATDAGLAADQYLAISSEEETRCHHLGCHGRRGKGGLSSFLP